MKKILNIFAFVFVILSVISLQSCLKDDNEVFSENSSTRMTEYLENATKTILSGDATWLMEMYPESSQCYGGYAFTMRFTKDSVYCRTELADPTYEEGSLWRTTRDDGPVISFDSYNNLIHYFSTPSSSAYEALEGEFEWVISDVQQDLITLRGKKTGNTIYMRRMTAGVEDYLNKLKTIESAISVPELEGTIGGSNAKAVMYSDSRQIKFTGKTDSTEVNVAYCVTDEGIRFYKPIIVNGIELTYLSINVDKDGYITGMTTNNGDIMNIVYPEGYRSYQELAGKYTFVDGDGDTYNPVVTCNGDGSTYTISGLTYSSTKVPANTVTAKYNKTYGSLEIYPQYIGKYGSYFCWICIDTAEGGTWSSSAKIIGRNDKDGNITFDAGSYTTLWEYACSEEQISSSNVLGYLTKYASVLQLKRKN